MHYATKTFRLRSLDGCEFIEHCGYCGAKAEQSIESHGDREFSYHYHCSCKLANREKNKHDEIRGLRRKIDRLQADINSIPVDKNMIKLMEYENEIRRVNQKYFGFGDRDEKTYDDGNCPWS